MASRADEAPVAPPAEVSRLYRRPKLSEVDIGYAGRHAASSPLHAAIAALRVGAPLELRRAGDAWELADLNGSVVGRFARAFEAPANFTCIRASVAAIIVRRREDTDAAYLDRVRCDEWEVVVPELVFEPER